MHSIQFRLSALFVLVATATLAIFGMYGHYQLSHELDANFSQLQKNMFSRLTNSLPVPMWDMNTEMCKMILVAEMQPTEIRGIQVFDATNQLFIGIARDKEGRIFSGAQENVAGGIPDEAPLYLQTDVMAGQQSGPAIGRVVVHFSRHRIEETLRANALRSALEVLVIDALLVLVLTLSLRLIFTPLGRLRDALFALAHQDDKEIKELPETQRNEFGEVVKGFNETQRKLKQVIERHRKAEEEAQKAMEVAKNKAGALAESKLLLQASAEDLQNQVAESRKTRKAMLNILEDLEVSRKETEATMHKINAMSQAVNDALVMIDGQGKVLFWNQAAEKLFGYTAAEAIGKDFHEMAVPSETREKARGGMNQFAATGQGAVFGSTIETVAINRQGLSFPVEVSLSPFQVNGKWFAVGTVRDITERKAAEESLRQAGNEQVAIFESLTLGIAFIKDRIILRGNTKLGELFGRPLDEMIGQTTRIWYKNEEEYLGIGASTYEDLKRQAIHQREQQLPRKDGSLFWCLFRVRAVDVHDISQGIVCTLEDITERKQAEKELKERMEELERFSRLTINREEKMIQLKEEINTLLEQMGKEKKYKIVE